ncbi:MAG: DUF2971 domain-containing protein [Candidatus Sedimenticola sp. (ex Thyasira tokunagai)]
MRELAILDEMDAQYIAKLLDSISFLEKSIDGLGFCLSEEGDLLSQWRGYAADATGVSIGFSKEYLIELADANFTSKKFSSTLQNVKYSKPEQMELLKPSYVEIKKLIDEGAFKNPLYKGLLTIGSEEEIEKENARIKELFSKLSINVLFLFEKLFVLKSFAFREEREWRLISLLPNGKYDAEYRATVGRIIPYREFDLQTLSSKIIEKVVIGPRNLTPPHVVEGLLAKSGFEDVEVTKSSATYRG